MAAPAAGFDMGGAWPVAGLAAHAEFRGGYTASVAQEQRSRGGAPKAAQDSRLRIERPIATATLIVVPGSKPGGFGGRKVAQAMLDVGFAVHAAHPSDRLRAGSKGPLSPASHTRRGQGPGVTRLFMPLEFFRVARPASRATAILARQDRGKKHGPQDRAPAKSGNVAQAAPAGGCWLANSLFRRTDCPPPGRERRTARGS